MPQLINETTWVTDDWIKVDANQCINHGSKVIVSQHRLQQQAQLLQSVPEGLGVELDPATAVEELLPFLDSLDIVVLRFDSFADGRAFSQARLLRDRYHYKGDIRAVGEVICDQLEFMKRCGFNQFLLADNEDMNLAFKSFSDISLSYQDGLRSTGLSQIN
jgi:uncharacterized protein (DUF934 family)